MSATSNIGRIKAIMRTMVANTAKWQTWTGTVTAETAAAFIFLKTIPDASFEDNPTLPELLISLDDFSSPEATGGVGLSVPSGRLKLTFYAPYAGGSLDTADDTVLDNVGYVLQQIIELTQVGTGDYLFLRGYSISEDETFPNLVERADHSFIRIEAMVDFGLELG